MKKGESKGWIRSSHSKGTKEDIFIQDNYYLVECDNRIVEQELDDYELDENFTLVFVFTKEAIETNRFKYYKGDYEVEIGRS